MDSPTPQAPPRDGDMSYKSPLQQSYLEKKALFHEEAAKLSETISKLKSSSETSSKSTKVTKTSISSIESTECSVVGDERENTLDSSNIRSENKKVIETLELQHQIDAEQSRLESLSIELSKLCIEEENKTKLYSVRRDDLQQGWDNLNR